MGSKFTIAKKKQPVHSSFMKKGMTFYRVSRDGCYLNDFKTKKAAKEYTIRLRKREQRELRRYKG